jgi:ribosome-interacting GTPase 1
MCYLLIPMHSTQTKRKTPTPRKTGKRRQASQRRKSVRRQSPQQRGGWVQFAVAAHGARCAMFPNSPLCGKNSN